MHSVWTMYTLFITVKIVFQSQQMWKKKKKMKTWTYKRGRGAQTPPQLKKVELPCPHYDNQVSIYSSLFLNTIKLKKKKKKNALARQLLILLTHAIGLFDS